MARVAGKMRWGDTLDDDDALPGPHVKGPDENGIKVSTDYFRNDKGEAIKKTVKTKTTTVEKKVYKVRRWGGWITSRIVGGVLGGPHGVDLNRVR